MVDVQPEKSFIAVVAPLCVIVLVYAPLHDTSLSPLYTCTFIGVICIMGQGTFTPP